MTKKFSIDLRVRRTYIWRCSKTFQRLPKSHKSLTTSWPRLWMFMGVIEGVRTDILRTQVLPAMPRYLKKAGRLRTWTMWVFLYETTFSSFIPSRFGCFPNLFVDSGLSSPKKDVPSGKLTKNHGKSQFSMGKSTINKCDYFDITRGYHTRCLRVWDPWGTGVFGSRCCDQVKKVRYISAIPQYTGQVERVEPGDAVPKTWLCLVTIIVG